jgi:hypothetical protein
MIHLAWRRVVLVLPAVGVAGVGVLTGCSAVPSHPAGAALPRAALRGLAAPSAGGWGAAQQVPGTAALNRGGDALMQSMSCASAGNCSGGGSYTDGSGKEQAFVVSQVRGTWQQAEEVPGTAALNRGGGAEIYSVSCPSAGNCGAGGYYADSAGHAQVLVVSQVNGIWRGAEEVPGTTALNQGGEAVIDSVSCASAGNCGAGGFYTDSSRHEQAFVVSEVRGTWQQAEEVPGTAALNQHGNAYIDSVSCPSAGDCSAGGSYTAGSSGSSEAFVVSEVRGTWQQAEEVPGTAVLNQGGLASINSVSCASAGDCSAGGSYTDGADHGQALVVSQVNGTWQQAEEVPGTAALNQDGGASIYSVSCASAGDCSAGGSYTDVADHGQALVVSQVNGTWQQAEEVPGAAALNQDGEASIDSVSCASAGDCSAGGSYADGVNHGQALVVSQVNGTWQQAEEAPGTAALNQDGEASIESVSCASAGNCSAAGEYDDLSVHGQRSRGRVLVADSGAWSM